MTDWRDPGPSLGERIFVYVLIGAPFVLFMVAMVRVWLP
jgi:hypothetical protein